MSRSRSPAAAAIVQVAVHGALNATRARFATYSAPPARDASSDAAIAMAAHDAPLALRPAARSTLDEELARSLQAFAEGAVKSRGIELGRQIAAATVMARFFDNDFVAFETTSGAPYPGLTRKFWSVSEAAQENGASRVLAGIHYPTAVRVGYELGESVGAWVVEHSLTPQSTTIAPATALHAGAR